MAADMWIRRLTLSQFRNYREQELDLPQGRVLLLGDNAQGKTNFMEAVFLLATTRSARALTDGELINWDTLAAPQPVARVTAQIERRDGPLELEVIVAGRPKGTGAARVPASKRLRVNGIARRQAGMVGQLTAVLFTTSDMELIGGPPAERRRFLDTMLSQLDSAYVQALQRYGKVVSQRNALLRRIQEQQAQPQELDFWDGELAKEGTVLVHQRAAAMADLGRQAHDAHRRLSGGLEELAISYQPRLEGWDGERLEAEPEAVPAALAEALSAGRGRDIGAGMTLTGPHRDDLSFAIDGVPAASFASRGQQRTAALALRLAEARFMGERKGDLPVVLLDDVLSELDEGRRRAVLDSLGDWDQLIVSSTDADRFAEALPQTAAVFRVSGGRIEPAP